MRRVRGVRWRNSTRSGEVCSPRNNPVSVADLSDEDVARRADQDNADDECHVKVPLLDTWAEFYRLWKEEGWTQQRIATAKGCDRTRVAKRIKRTPNFVLPHEKLCATITSMKAILMTFLL